MEKKCKNLCIMLIFSVCSCFVLLGFIVFDHAVLGNKARECNCTKCDVKSDNVQVIDDNTVVDDSPVDSVDE